MPTLSAPQPLRTELVQSRWHKWLGHCPTAVLLPALCNQMEVKLQVTAVAGPPLTVAKRGARKHGRPSPIKGKGLSWWEGR